MKNSGVRDLLSLNVTNLPGDPTSHLLLHSYFNAHKVRTYTEKEMRQSDVCHMEDIKFWISVFVKWKMSRNHQVWGSLLLNTKIQKVLTRSSG